MLIFKYIVYLDKKSLKVFPAKKKSFANGLSLGNIKTWEFNNQKSELSFIYDFGEYKAERKLKSLDKLLEMYLLRNLVMNFLYGKKMI